MEASLGRSQAVDFGGAVRAMASSSREKNFSFGPHTIGTAGCAAGLRERVLPLHSQGDGQPSGKPPTVTCGKFIVGSSTGRVSVANDTSCDLGGRGACPAGRESEVTHVKPQLHGVACFGQNDKPRNADASQEETLHLHTFE